ncbi:MAG TPA: hypothetical protein PKV96_03390 [Candidatus Saccharimonas sp.]|nr:hypothetical protein [Candidatus Saccharimonas sp.]
MHTNLVRAIDDLLCAISYCGVPAWAVELTDDYLNGKDVRVPESTLRQTRVREAITTFATRWAEEPQGERAAMLLL